MAVVAQCQCRDRHRSCVRPPRPRHRPANGGDASYEQLRQQFPAEFAQLLEVRTGSGSTHLYFECGSPTPSRANILPGIDVKADGGYVVAPPSLDVSGVPYRFASNSGLLLPPLSQALRDFIFKASGQQSQSQHSQSQSQQSQGQQSHGQNQQSPGQQSQKPSQQTAGIQPDPVPWPDPVDGVVLFNELTAAFGRYLALPEGALEAMALWVLFTHTFDAAEVSPRLALLSPVPECGKTTASLDIRSSGPQGHARKQRLPSGGFQSDRPRPSHVVDG